MYIVNKLHSDSRTWLIRSKVSTMVLTRMADGGSAADSKNIKVTLNGLCGINGATVRLGRSPQIHQQPQPSAQAPGDAFHVLQRRDITEASSTLCCPSSNNASKHQIRPTPTVSSPLEMKAAGVPSGPPTLKIYIFGSAIINGNKRSGCALLLF